MSKKEETSDNKLGQNNIHIGKGGNYVGGNVSADKGFVMVGSKARDVNFTNNLMSMEDNQKLSDLFASLQLHIDSASTSTPEQQVAQMEAKDAAQSLQQEVEAVKKDPEYKPNKFQMQGLIAAFKKVGGPIFSVAMSIIGFPALGAAVNQFVEKLPDSKSS